MSLPSPVVRTENDRIYLRDIRLGDAVDRYVAWLNDSDVNRYLESRFSRHTSATVEAYIREHTQSPDVFLLAICTKPDGKHIGNIKVGPIDRIHGTADVGLMIGDREEWGHGYGTEAIALVTGFAFDELGLRRLTAGAYRENGASVRAFQRCGYRIEGVLRNHRQLGDGRTDVILVGLLAEDVNTP